MWGALSDSASTRPSWVTIGVVALFMISTTFIFFGLIRHLARVLLQPSQYSKAALLAHDASGTLHLQESFAEVLPLVLLTILVIVTGLAIWSPLAAVLTQSVAILVQ